MAQIVPIKLKTGTDDYRQWSGQHKHEGKGIPIVYIVRADGKTLYAKSGKPKTEKLGNMLMAALDDAGYIMTERDISIVERVTREVQKHRAKSNVAAAVHSLKKAKNYLTKDGDVASYSESAIALQVEIDAMLQTATAALAAANTAIENVGNDESEMVAAIELFAESKERYAPLKSLKRDISAIQSRINKDVDLKKLQSSLKIIWEAENATSKTKKVRSIKRLKAWLADSPADSLVERAESALIKLQQ